MEIREVGDGFVAIDGDRALSIEGDAAAALRAGGLSRRQMLTRIGAGAAVAGVSYLALPIAAAHASQNNGATPVITLSPVSGPEGTLVQVTGTGFAVSTDRAVQTVSIGGIAVSPSTTLITAAGGFVFTFIVPAGVTLGAGNTVSVTDNHNNTATATFTVTTPGFVANKITSFPKNGAGTQKLQVGGSGFTPGDTLTFTNGAVSDFTSVTAEGAPIIATAAGEIPTGTLIDVTYANGGGTGSIKVTDQHGHTFTSAPITH